MAKVAMPRRAPLPGAAPPVAPGMTGALLPAAPGPPGDVEMFGLTQLARRRPGVSRAQRLAEAEAELRWATRQQAIERAARASDAALLEAWRLRAAPSLDALLQELRQLIAQSSATSPLDVRGAWVLWQRSAEQLREWREYLGSSTAQHLLLGQAQDETLAELARQIETTGSRQEAQRARCQETATKQKQRQAKLSRLRADQARLRRQEQAVRGELSCAEHRVLQMQNDLTQLARKGEAEAAAARRTLALQRQKMKDEIEMRACCALLPRLVATGPVRPSPPPREDGWIPPHLSLPTHFNRRLAAVIVEVTEEILRYRGELTDQTRDAMLAAQLSDGALGPYPGLSAAFQHLSLSGQAASTEAGSRADQILVMLRAAAEQPAPLRCCYKSLARLLDGMVLGETAG